jgi:serralysin
MVFQTASGSNALRMNQFNFDRLTDIDSVIVQKTSSTLIIDVDGLRYTFTGSGVRYNNFDEPVGGTITGLTVASGGNVLFQVGGFAISAPTFYLATYAPDSPFRLIYAGNDEFRGSALDDVIVDTSGHNVIFGGAGADSLRAGGGNDHIYGQSPNGGDDGNDEIYAGGGSDYVQGNAGNDHLFGEDGSDRINGGAGDDRIYGGNGHDVINGNRDNDYIFGEAGNDILRGGQGNDFLNGGADNDIIMGDLGADTMEGGAGADIFIFGPATSLIDGNGGKLDKITDFGFGDDRMSLGFLPTAVLTYDTVATGTTQARAFAQMLFDQHAGNQEVAIIQVRNESPILFWASDGGGFVDSGTYIANTNPPHIYTVSDFI